MTMLKSILYAFCILSLVVSPPVAFAKSGMTTVSAEIQKRDPTIVLTLGKADIVDVGGQVSDIMVANPAIVDVAALQANRIYLVGAAVGNTNILALDAQGNILKRLNVHVRVDELNLQETLSRLFPEESVSAQTVNNDIILTGRVSTPARAAQIRDLAERFIGGSQQMSVVNMMDVRGEQQVMLRVKVVEASRDVLRELGVEANYQNRGQRLSGSMTSRLQSNILTQAGEIGIGVPVGLATAGLSRDPFAIGSLIYDNGPHRLAPLIRALEDDGLMSTLAEPNLTAISGEQAGFLAGGEYPVPIARDRDGNVQIEYKPFGVALNFKPVVMSDQRISMQMSTEVSSISNQNSQIVGDLVIPSFSVRRAETTVELPSGGSLMIAGLLQSEMAKSMSQLPGIGNIPIIGRLFSSESFQRNETELLVIITPYIVTPYGDEKQAEYVPQQGSSNNALSNAFADNIRRIYGDRAKSDATSNREKFGYLLD